MVTVRGSRSQTLGTESLAFYPMVKKTYGACTQAMQDFCGTEVLHQLSSDNTPELVRTPRELMVPHATATTYRSTSNGKVENIIGQVLS
eukprot:3457320-Heterocapsa_arctica.AAC.1